MILKAEEEYNKMNEGYEPSETQEYKVEGEYVEMDEDYEPSEAQG